MSPSDRVLVKWAQKDQRPGVTLGQLTTLLELASRDSVAAMAPGSASDAVNYRQKLDRLEKALGVGRLTHRVGKVTQVSELGRRVAGEVRLMLMELTQGARRSATPEPWIFGAGDTWLQSVVIPTLARWPKAENSTRWRIANLRSHAVCEALSEGRIQFGLLRSADMPDDHGLEILKTYPGVGYSMLVSGAGRKFEHAAQALAWVIKERHPLIQQGTTWPMIAGVLAAEGLGGQVESAHPDVICETHPQAANSVVNGRGWAVVPSVVARNFDPTEMQILNVTRNKPADEIAFVTNLRMLEKLNGGVTAANALKQELGLTISGAKK